MVSQGRRTEYIEEITQVMGLGIFYIEMSCDNQQLCINSSWKLHKIETVSKDYQTNFAIEALKL